MFIFGNSSINPALLARNGGDDQRALVKWNDQMSSQRVRLIFKRSRHNFRFLLFSSISRTRDDNADFAIAIKIRILFDHQRCCDLRQLCRIEIANKQRRELDRRMGHGQYRNTNIVFYFRPKTVELKTHKHSFNDARKKRNDSRHSQRWIFGRKQLKKLLNQLSMQRGRKWTISNFSRQLLDVQSNEA